MAVAVIFEVWPADGRLADYLDFAAQLRRELDTMDGFVSVERFQSLSEPGKVLSLSFWRDEAAVARWRNLPSHRAVQAEGRAGVFRDYRLRVVSVTRDYGMHDRAEVPDDSQAYHAPERARHPETQGGSEAVHEAARRAALARAVTAPRF